MSRRARFLPGMGLFVGGPLQYWLGASLLHHQPFQQFSVSSVFGVLLVFTSTLVFMAGLGELLNFLTEASRR